MHFYLCVRDYKHPGPRYEVSKYCLWWAAYEHGFDFQVK